MKQEQRHSSTVSGRCDREQMIRHTKKWLRSGYRLIAISKDCEDKALNKVSFNVEDLIEHVEKGEGIYLSHIGTGNSINIQKSNTIEHPGLSFQYLVRGSVYQNATSPVRLKKTSWSSQA